MEGTSVGLKGVKRGMDDLTGMYKMKNGKKIGTIGVMSDEDEKFIEQNPVISKL